MSLTEKENAIRIISEAFVENPSVLHIVKPDAHKAERIKHLADYVYETSNMRKGVFFSKDREAIALCYRYNFRKEGLRDYFNQAKLVFRTIGVERVFKILKRDAYVKKQRPADGNFLYFWFFGSSNKARGGRGAWELKEKIFEQSKKLNLPIYLETSIPQNKLVYQRFGFETYHVWDGNYGNQPLYFMRRLADKS
ncbi:MAG: hypothetical protein RLQ12_10800 [Cyclobacteriaceae bacterium]